MRSRGRFSYLTMTHAAVLANYLRRPVFIIDAERTVNSFGCGHLGVAAAFTPVRHSNAELASRQPVVIAWSNNKHVHFVPMVPVLAEEQVPRVRWALPHPMYSPNPDPMLATFFDRSQVDCDDYRRY